MVRPRVIIGPAKLQAAREAYETGEAAYLIAERLGISDKALGSRAYRLKWRRKQRLAKTPADAPPDEARAGWSPGASRRTASAAAPSSTTKKPDRLALVRRVRGAVEREIAGAERLLAEGGAGEAHVERTARTLASLVRTLRELNALDDAPPAEPLEQESPRDLDEFRRELAARLDRLRAADEGPPAGEPVGAGDRDVPG